MGIATSNSVEARDISMASGAHCPFVPHYKQTAIITVWIIKQLDVTFMLPFISSLQVAQHVKEK